MKFKIAIIWVGLCIGTAHLHAQSISVETTGTVLEPLSLSGSDLSFGSIYPGVEKTVSYSDSYAAEFIIKGQPGETISADFTLPSFLEHTGGDLPTLPVIFDETDSGYNIFNDPSEATDHDPGTTLTTTFGTGENHLYIWLGGSVAPGERQEKGDYTGNITLNIAYTGN